MLMELYTGTTLSAEHTMAIIGMAKIDIVGTASGMHMVSGRAGSTLMAYGSGTLRFALPESLDCGYRSLIDCF
jgi:hypothetical protein